MGTAGILGPKKESAGATLETLEVTISDGRRRGSGGSVSTTCTFEN
jgi:hypothetical protein